MCRQEMNQCYIVKEQDRDSTPVCDGFSESCQIGFLFFLRMWNVYITSSTGCRGESTLWCCSYYVWCFYAVATESIPVGFCVFHTFKQKKWRSVCAKMHKHHLNLLSLLAYIKLKCQLSMKLWEVFIFHLFLPFEMVWLSLSIRSTHIYGTNTPRWKYILHYSG